MADRVVGISEYVVSTESSDTLITYSLGSCVALVLHDPVAGIAGLLHAMMPSSKGNPEKAASSPAMYADTGAQQLLQELFEAGANRANLTAKVIGAASQFDETGLFRIGERNHAVVRKVLWKNGIFIAAEDVGGAVSRSVYVRVADGQTLVKTQDGTREL